MQQTYIENIAKVLKDKKKLEKELKIKITNKGKNIFVDGKPENEFIALKIIEALDFGFSVDAAFQLNKEEIIFQVINIKDLTKRKDIERIKARIIGTRGKTLETLKNLTECNICLHENQIAIIGYCEEIRDAIQALTSIVHGSKQSNVYARLEKQRKNKNIENKISIKNELEKL